MLDNSTELLNNGLDASSKLVDIFWVVESLARPKLHTRVSGYMPAIIVTYCRQNI